MRRLLRDAAAMEILTHAIIHHHLPVTLPGDRPLTTLSTSVHSQNLKADWTYPLKQGEYQYWCSLKVTRQVRVRQYISFFSGCKDLIFPCPFSPFHTPMPHPAAEMPPPKVQIHLEHLGSVESISVTRTSKQTANASVFWKKNKKNIQATAYITYIFT